MKKYILLITILFLFVECKQENDNLVEKTILEEVSTKNKQFFNEIALLKEIRNKDEFSQKLEKLKVKFNVSSSDLSKKGNVNPLNRVQNKILKSYFEDLKTKRQKIKFSNEYLQYVNNMNISDSDKYFCLNAVDFYKNFMIYLDYKDVEKDMSFRHSPCAHRDCMDCCMYRKARQIEDSNWIEQAWFLSGAAGNVAAWAAGCGWDCWY